MDGGQVEILALQQRARVVHARLRIGRCRRDRSGQERQHRVARAGIARKQPQAEPRVGAPGMRLQDAPIGLVRCLPLPGSMQLARGGQQFGDGLGRRSAALLFTHDARSRSLVVPIVSGNRRRTYSNPLANSVS